MKRIFLILFIILLSISPMSAKTLKGGVEYTESQIKKMAFDGVKKKLPRKMIEANKIDPFYDENMAMMKKGVRQTNDRILRLFDNGEYAVTYMDNIFFTYFYHSTGKLKIVKNLIEHNSFYPTKSLVYDSDGILRVVVIFVRKGKGYVYNLKGNLIYEQKD